jgi:amidase
VTSTAIEGGTMSENSDLCSRSLIETAALIKNREISPVELTQALLDRISSVDEKLRSFVTVTADLAQEQARTAEKEIASGRYRGPLHGVGVGVKDLFYTKGIRTGCGSTILADWVPDSNATAVEKLNEAGAVMLGKLVMTEFALSGYHPAFEPPVNPWNAERWAGVSSSGSAVAVSASLCFASLGTDTGGSIRFPSGACGVVGIKPTYGRVSRHGVFPLAETLDHVGPFGRRVADAAAVLSAIAGQDPNDPTSLRDDVPDFTAGLNEGVQGLRIGIDHSYCSQNIDAEVTAAVSTAADVLSDLGAEVREVDVSGITEICSHWSRTAAVEALSTHGERYYPARADDYGPVFRNFLEDAGKVTASDRVDANRARLRVRERMDGILSDVDMLLCPTMATPAMKLKDFPPQLIVPPEVTAVILAVTAPFNFTGNPTISVPCGFSEDGLPVSLQLVGRHGGEATIIRAANGFEQATDWHEGLPEI